MTYFKDLSHCTYLQIYPANYLAVGWLSSEFPYTHGRVSEKVHSALEELVKKPINLCLGFHNCEFCQIPKEILHLNKEHQYRWENQLLGNGEIHIPGANGIIYRSPALIYHYVKDHQYKPPEEFIQTVEAWWENEKPKNVRVLDTLLHWWTHRKKAL